MLSSKKVRTSLVAGAVTMLSVGIVFAPGAMAQTGGAMGGAMGSKMHGKARRERHPELRIARAALMRAKQALMHANRDFAGHRTAAVNHINEALGEIQQAYQADKQ